MIVKIHFHKTLQKYTNIDIIELDVEDLRSLSLALNTLYPELMRDFVKDIKNNQLLILLNKNRQIITQKDLLYDSIDETNNELYIAPAITGHGGGKSGIIFGALLASFAFFALPALAGASLEAGFLAAFQSLEGVSGFIAQSLLGVGLNLVLGGILQLIQKKPTENRELDVETRQNNDSFGPLQNTIDTGTPISINYGLIRVSGHFISGYVKTIDHGKEDVVAVSDQFNS